MHLKKIKIIRKSYDDVQNTKIPTRTKIKVNSVQTLSSAIFLYKKVGELTRIERKYSLR